MNTATKIAHIITIFLILSAFCISPVVASAENDEFVNTQTETKTLSDEEINANFDEAIKKSGIKLCQMYRKIHGDDGLDYILFDDVNPHPYWEHLVKNGDTLRIIPGTEPGERYALVYPPKDDNTQKPWILPGAKAALPAALPIGLAIAKITPEYSPGSSSQPPHYHAGLPQNNKLKHCSPHCFWDYTDFFKKRGMMIDL